ncbi:GDSL-type esterase/lipase family protein [Novosphingobium sp.]|uniref:GDSL-type esterase/lipase family protein n=1 Tax=Novosphingobium sp. TaxID=1874826 RepID=UPI0025FBC3B2|nr:GDSL-type esterase/lipase family protein [Novosphingobium sp.]MCC6926129.1 GDSL family lipase [Novosphingobium sp.]
MADEPIAPPANAYPPAGMMDNACPASRDGLWALDPKVLQNDWAWLCRYQAENAKVDRANPPRAVFIGDSITEGWLAADPDMFAHGFLDRGLSGQTSPQLLVRFWQDVVALRPKVVHIMVGTNDVAGNTGPTTPEAYRNAIRAMVALARANGIEVVIGSILPTDHFNWAPQHRPAPWVATLNAWLRDYAETEGLVYANYYAALVGPGGALPQQYAPDGVHPNKAGYAVMRPIAERAVAEAEARAGKHK